MSAVSIRSALEAALNAMSPALLTAWEGNPFSPVQNTPWQRVNLLHAEPRPMEQGGTLHEEGGFMQVSLFYPLNSGPSPAETRAELVRSTFRHGTSFVSGNVKVTVSNTPSIITLDDPAWLARAVRIPFYAQIRRS